MSPIFVRPVREQLEHDRLIRFLQAKYKRKFEVALNVADEQVAPVKIGQGTFFPDLVLTDGKKLGGVVEVETGESINNLEAMAQWVHFSKARVPFHLYLPITGYDVARRLCDSHGVKVAEIWSYRPLIEGFDLVRVHHDPHAEHSRKPAAASAKAPSAASRKPASPSTGAKSAKAMKTAKKTGAVSRSKPPSSKTKKSAAKRTSKPVKPSKR